MPEREQNSNADIVKDLTESLAGQESLKGISRDDITKTLKAIFDLGYDLKIPEKTVLSASFEEANSVLELLQGPNKPDLNVLTMKWNGRNPEKWPATPKVYQLLGERFLKLGSPLAACDVFTEGLSKCNNDLRLRQLLGLGLARSGGTTRAQKILLKLCQEGDSSEETLGLLARTYKDLWMQTSDSEKRKLFLSLAKKYYSQAYAISGGYWTGINAATMAFLLDEKEEASLIASKVELACLEDLKKLTASGADVRWALATLGEVNLILGKRAEAKLRYSQAAEAGRERYGDLSSTRRNARLLLKHMGDDGSDIEKCFNIPPVVVFAGWIKGGECVVPPPISGDLELKLSEEIKKKLKNLGFSLAYSSAATPLDLLFLETIKSMNGEINVILADRRAQKDNSDRKIDGESKIRIRLEQVLSKAAQVLTVSDQNIQEDNVASEYAELFLLGMANLRARQLETGLIPFIVCEGNPDSRSENSFKLWERVKKLGLKAEIIDHHNGSNDPTPPPQQAGSRKSFQTQKIEKNEDFSTVIRSLFFGDAYHFSKLSEEQIPIFNKEFLGPIGKMANVSPYAPIVKNTWGDGLYFVFETVRNAGLFALEVCEFVNSVDWLQKGLPETMNLRIALHAGPVFSCIDPITQTKTFTGTHVSRAARIEPITPVGQVYASQAFAALSAAEYIEEFTCEYVGQTPLAKGYGTFPTYHVRRILKG